MTINKHVFGVVVVSIWLGIALQGITGECQTAASASSDEVRFVMDRALARCYSTTNGVRRISWEPPTNEDFAKIKVLGEMAVLPLANYLDLDKKNGFTQLLAVKFLIVIGGPSTLQPLRRAVAPDQWEVTRAQALSGLFEVSKDDARPFVEAALKDTSPVVRQRAHDLIMLYPQKAD